MARYQLTTTAGRVFDTETGTYVSTIDGGWLADAYQQWLDAGNKPDPAPQPTFADYVARYTPMLQQWMEDVARSNAYDSVISCVSYKDSGVPQFAGDARAMIDWRDALWKWASAWQAGFNGQLPETLPTVEEVKALAPQPEAFGWVVHPPGQIIEAVAPIEQTS